MRYFKIQHLIKIPIPIAVALLFFMVSSAFALNFGYDDFDLVSTFSFSDGDRSASADFSFSGDTLTLTLTNTYSGSVSDPVHVLQAVFFDLTGNTALTRVSGNLGSGSEIFYLSSLDSNTDGTVDSSDAFGGNVGGEYAYSSILVGAPNGAQQGISGVGYSLPGFDSAHLFPGANLDGPVAPNGPGFGLVSAGYNEGDGNGGVTGSPKVKNSVVYALSGASGLGIGDVSNVSFEYGTDLEQVPEPSSLILLGSGLLGLGFFGRKRLIK